MSTTNRSARGGGLLAAAAVTLGVALAAGSVAAGGAGAAGAAGGVDPEAIAARTGAYPDAVVLVSGFTTSTPFTTPDPSCNGQEGASWDPSAGVATALKAAGHDVFTAPISSTVGGVPTPCLGSSSFGPGPVETINSNGEADRNGKALALFLKFLGKHYGVKRVQLVGHSDGGLWSRAAITRSSRYSDFLEVRSLTTLGTPHTGSWVADLVSTVGELRCSNLDGELKTTCKSVISGVTGGSRRPWAAPPAAS